MTVEKEEVYERGRQIYKYINRARERERGSWKAEVLQRERERERERDQLQKLNGS